MSERAESAFEGELSRTVGPTMAAALVEFFRLNPHQKWFIHKGEIHQVIGKDVEFRNETHGMTIYRVTVKE